MFKWLKQLKCKHKKVIWLNCELVKVQGNEWKTQHYWKCEKCGKVIKGK